MIRQLLALICFVSAVSMGAADTTASRAMKIKDNPVARQLHVVSGDQQLFVYNYADTWDLPHIYPLNTPSGKNLLVQKTDPYPHHRSFWVSDTVKREGVKGDIYNGYYSGVKIGKQKYEAPYVTRSRHESFSEVNTDSKKVSYDEKLVWETSTTETAFPLLNEYREVAVYDLDNGNYLVDFRFSLIADYGDVEFISDPVHYAWPYLRINSQFSVDGGGTLTSDSGTTGQELTNLKSHHWIDYSNTVDGDTEGVAVFQWPFESAPRKWLTRNYGTFGPRRPDAQSGKPFVLSNGESLTQRIGVYVHKGDADTGNVGDIYTQYVNGDVDK